MKYKCDSEKDIMFVSCDFKGTAIGEKYCDDANCNLCLLNRKNFPEQGQLLYNSGVGYLKFGTFLVFVLEIKI